MKRGLICLTLLLLCSCRTGPSLKPQDIDEGNWRAKALIKDNEQHRSYIVHLAFNSQRGRSTRMDVTSSIGTGVASLLVDDKEVRYILLDSKKFYYGTPQAGVMRPILAIPFDPRWLRNILFEIPIEEKGWHCTTDANGLLLSCLENNGLRITWSARQGDKRTIQLEHSKASVQINIQSFKPKVEERKNLFSLDAPEGFQKLRVR